MKKILIIIVLILLTSCKMDYKCVIKYQIDYPDTSWVNTYTFDGDRYASYRVNKVDDKGRQILYVWATSTSFSKNIATVADRNADIKVLDFKLYKKGIDTKEYSFFDSK